MNKADVVLDNAIKPNQDAPIILEPCKQSLNFPAPTITVEFPSILGLLLLSVRAMGRNQFHSIFSQLLVQRIAVIRLVTNQTLGQLFGEHGVQSRFYKGDLMRRSTANGYGDRKTRAVCHCHDLCTFAPFLRWQRCHQWNIRSNRDRHALSCLVPGPSASPQTHPSEPISGSVDGKSGRVGIALAYLSIVHRCAWSTKYRWESHDRRAEVCHVHQAVSEVLVWVVWLRPIVHR